MAPAYPKTEGWTSHSEELVYYIYIYIYVGFQGVSFLPSRSEA